ncbi:hypothetical protein B0G69_5767 [Paraburkholderia sp. RAU2J]|nr:hypothetical protein B0G69_5767 [Paraburkholderia sp. RAU2J]
MSIARVEVHRHIRTNSACSYEGGFRVSFHVLRVNGAPAASTRSASLAYSSDSMKSIETYRTVDTMMMPTPTSTFVRSK